MLSFKEFQTQKCLGFELDKQYKNFMELGELEYIDKKGLNWFSIDLFCSKNTTKVTVKKAENYQEWKHYLDKNGKIVIGFLIDPFENEPILKAVSSYKIKEM